ncbi:MAG: 30S ribosomal protein S8 [Candidatus Pacearchaeota archaeon]|nr:30S ribosomal protein S8 [Candidatus Pacearchaeota archaeon]
MIRDWLSAFLNDIMNCKRAGKKETSIVHWSNLILEVLKVMKKEGYIKNIRIEENKFRKIIVEIGKINKCQAIKPRFPVRKNEFEKYIRRYLPARDIGILIVSTSKGIMTHKEAIEKGLGGVLLAYCF